MNSLFTLSRWIDSLNESAGKLVMWLVLIATLVATGNALAKYLLGEGSNAWLEAQWYGFGAMFLLGAGYTLRHNGHVRIDILYQRLSPKGQAWIDLLGGVLFLLPVAGLLAWLSWPLFLESWRIQEMSPDEGGLIRWPVKLLLPLGFALLLLQCISEIIKRIGVIRGDIAPITEKPSEEV
ncbi:MAG: TRAP transporter small permease subunit [Hydrogenophilaceae bacterium]|nr:TRAP transporter small permease subunit [Hydrogenophilaceae bacterium]